MKLIRLELFGFKSFPQRTSVQFDEGITGIVGPNGSGKSNIADAVRWVLGEQSAKALRGAKMEDVIFVGTQKRKLMPYCEVSLIFDNQDQKLKNPHTEVMVTRRVYRSGEGEYYLNKKSCRLKDIVELFHDTGIGREGYSIIGQGHIDVILSGRGEERRAAFEDAAGIAAYRSRKEEAERKLTRTQEHLLRVGDLLEELGSRLEPLREQSEAAREYLQLSARLKSLDATIFLARHDRLNKRITSLKENNQGIAEMVALHEKKLEETRQKRLENEDDLALAESESERVSGILRQQEDALREQAVLKERSEQTLQMAVSEEKTNRDSIQALEEEIKELENMLSSSSSESDREKMLLDEADKALSALEEEEKKAQDARERAENALDEHRSRLLESANSRTDARERQARQQAMLAQAKSRISDIKNNEALLTDAVTIAEQEETAAKNKLNDTRDAVNALYEQLKHTESKLSSDREQVRLKEQAFSQAQLALQRDKARLSAMEEMARSHEGFFQPVKQALSYAKGNRKVFGALAQLIDVPKELETAIEMVLGSALQNIVTQDEETAQELIDYLREKRYGRTTFLPLSAVRGRALNPNERAVLSMPGCLGVASELVSYDTKYQDVVESLLGRTVVAEDLNAAIAISRKGRQAFHVVTLQGDVMRSGGAMTGGSVQSKTVSLLGREREIKELSASINAQAENLLKAQQAFSALTAELKKTEEIAVKERLHAQDEEIAIAREEERVKQANERLENANQRLSQSNDAKTQLLEMIAQIEQDLSGLDQASKLIDEDREAMEKEDLRLKAEMAAAREAAENLREQLEEAREKKAHLAHRLDLVHRDRQRFEKECAALRQKQDRLKQNGSSLLDKIAGEKQKAAELSGMTAQMNLEIQSVRDLSAQAEGKRRELTALQKRLMDDMETTHRLYNEDSQKLHRGELSLTRLQEELHTITATLFNTHELTYALAAECALNENTELPALEKEAGDIRKQIKDMGAINIHALDEYAATQNRFNDLSVQRDDAQQAREDLLNLIKRLQGQMEKQFVREFALLNEYFAETFKRLFNGGQASLSLADPSQPLECEIQIKAQPPGKKLQLLSLLSGGERTLTAIAILFAMLKLKPTPFCILDEIEAALDDANIYSFANYLKEYSKDTQFIVITHRKGTMESCDMLYGVTMREKGVSDIISVNLQEYTA
ncbi:MAG: chromosome segregation protein SMC [Bacillota bacterium]|nr:chromosome segregation protein SMC [Bacillota bacterium]